MQILENTHLVWRPLSSNVSFIVICWDFNHHPICHQMATLEQIPPRQQSWPRSSTWGLSPSPGSIAGNGNDDNRVHTLWPFSFFKTSSCRRIGIPPQVISCNFSSYASKWKEFLLLRPTLSFGQFPPQCFAPLNIFIIIDVI